jgi:regulator of protease activity HflC (stomatin/prohibitin superfamily)
MTDIQVSTDQPPRPVPLFHRCGAFFTRAQAASKRWLHRNLTSILIWLFFIVLMAIALAPSIFITIPPGHVGVLWQRFFGGTVVDATYGEGMRIIFPWDAMYIYDARLQNNSRVYDTISSDGLSMQVDIAVRYRINPDSVGVLHKFVGPDYAEVLVYPEIGSHARELISRYSPEQLYTQTRAFIQAEIFERMVNELGSSLVNQSLQGKLVTVEDVLIRSIKLPDRVAEAIERKSEQQQIMLEYDFRLTRESKERERKRIEAEGIRDFQDVVARTITPEYLRLRGIEATIALATSQNSKTVIIGGKDGLPVILNTGSDAQPPQVKESSRIPLTEDRKAPVANPTSLNARPADVPPPNAITPGVNSASNPAGTQAKPGLTSAPVSSQKATAPGPDPKPSPSGSDKPAAIADGNS